LAGANPELVRGIDAAFSSPQMRATRLAMLEGREVAACDYCYAREAFGAASYRQYVNRQFGAAEQFEALLERTGRDGSFAEFPSFLDLRFGNACNLECVMCGFPASSRWGRREGLTSVEAHIDPYVDDEELFNVLAANAHRIRRIHFAGGEPFMQRRHFTLIDILLASGAAHQIDLVYTTNLTVLPRNFLDGLREFSSVELAASCDGIGEVYERIRVGGTWERFVRNVEHVQEHEHVRIFLMVSPQRDNIAHLGDLLTWATAKGLEVELMNVVMEPNELSVRSLPAWEKELRGAELAELSDRYSERSNVVAGLRHLIAFMESPDRSHATASGRSSRPRRSSRRARANESQPG
jgi:MoaA/NifB/PqqE/SkfB family radical SAM enzyme